MLSRFGVQVWELFCGGALPPEALTQPSVRDTNGTPGQIGGILG
jgi:hypothetical protein